MQPIRVSRFDVAEIGKPTRTPQGFLRVPAALTRTGVLTYRRADGTTVRELRPPEEVFREDSLSSLGYAPVTDLHPTEMVSPANVRKLAIGHVSAVVHKDGDLVAGTITIEDADAIKAVDEGKRREVSCGYNCRLDATPGTYNGERYDVVQRDIVYNHAALGPRGWGRAGSHVALRVDGKDDDAAKSGDVFRLDSGDAVNEDTFGAPSERGDAGEEDDMDLITMRVDGLDVQLPKQTGQVVEKAIKTREDSLTTVTRERDTLQGKFDAQVAELAETKKKLAEANDPKRLDEAVNARASLLEQAKRVLPADHKFDGLTTRQIQEAVIKRIDDKLDMAGKSDDYVTARFDGAIASHGAGSNSNRNDALDEARRRSVGSSGGGGGAGSNQPRNDAAAPLRAAWQQPLAVTKDAR